MRRSGSPRRSSDSIPRRASRWRDIAVIFRKNKDMALIRDALQALDVPVEVGSLGGLLDLPDVADLHAWLRTIERPGDSIALARLLLGPAYRLGLRDIAALSRWIKPQSLPARRRSGPGLAAGRGDRPTRGNRGLQRRGPRPAAVVPHASIAASSSLLRAPHWWTCAAISSTRPGCGTRSRLAEPGPALTARVNLYRFLDLAEEWSPLRGRPTLPGLPCLSRPHRQREISHRARHCQRGNRGRRRAADHPPRQRAGMGDGVSSRSHRRGIPGQGRRDG